MSTITFAKAIKLILSDKKFKDVVQNKVYPLIAPLNTSYPYLVFQRNSSENRSKDHQFQENVNIEIIIVSDNYDSSIHIAELVRSEFESIKNEEIEGFKINNVSLINNSETYANDAFLQNLTFNFKINL